MAEQKDRKLNQIERTLPEGLLVDAGWMEQHGYSTSLRSQYVSAGWLVQPVRGTFKRPLGELSLQKVVVSLQKLLCSDLVVGGRPRSTPSAGFQPLFIGNGTFDRASVRNAAAARLACQTPTQREISVSSFAGPVQNSCECRGIAGGHVAARARPLGMAAHDVDTRARVT